MLSWEILQEERLYGPYVILCTVKEGRRKNWTFSTLVLQIFYSGRVEFYELWKGPIKLRFRNSYAQGDFY